MKRILVIDDEPPVALLVGAALTHAGVEHTVEHCSDGAQGKMRASQGGYDLITLDLTMPMMDGFEALKEMKAGTRSSHIPVVVLTARKEVELHKLACDLGACTVVTKPFTADSLGPVLKSALGV